MIKPVADVIIFTYNPPEMVPISIIPFTDTSWKIVITPIIVPTNPSIGAIPAMIPRILIFFSSTVAGNQGSTNGDPLSPDYGEGGSGNGSYALDLKSRRFTNLTPPKDDGQKYGKVAVRIFVDKNGVVVNAIPGVKGTTLSDKEIWEKCRLAVIGSSLNKLESAPDVQIGVVMFNFKVK